MNATHDDPGLPSSLSAKLRREARSTRPDFSDPWHLQLMERIASDRVSLPSAGEFVEHRWSKRLPGAIMVATALVVVLAVFGAFRGLEETWRRAPDIPSGNHLSLDEAAVPGIEALPLYDDIDASVRASMWMLASSLVEVPDWARLADFDAAAVPRDSPVP